MFDSIFRRTVNEWHEDDRHIFTFWWESSKALVVTKQNDTRADSLFHLCKCMNPMKFKELFHLKQKNPVNIVKKSTIHSQSLSRYLFTHATSSHIVMGFDYFKFLDVFRFPSPIYEICVVSCIDIYGWIKRKPEILHCIEITHTHLLHCIAYRRFN